MKRWSTSASLAATAVWLLVCLAFAYVPDMGHGFIADDFGWIGTSRVRSVADLTRTFAEAPMGFYRPLVTLSFAFDFHLFGLAPFGYALSNFAMALAVAVGIAWLVRARGFGTATALFAAALWTFNIHGVGMALTWISGRTSLLATLWAVAGAVAISRTRPMVAGVCTLLALLTKEEPIFLPLILASWLFLDARARDTDLPAALGEAARGAGPSFAALIGYLALRASTPAFTPSNAPSFYALSASPAVVLPNLLEYLDRSLTFTTAVLALGVLVVITTPGRRLPRLDADERRLMKQGLVWIALGFGVTLFLPVRSDLYACFPSVGSALAGAAAGQAVWRAMPASRRRVALVGLGLLPALLVPVYHGRNLPPRRDAELSRAVVARVAQALSVRPRVSRVTLYQRPGEKPSLSSALGGSLPEAVALTTGVRVNASIESLPIPPEAVSSMTPDDTTLRFVIRNGTVTLLNDARER
jgi:hypothetical protein